MLSSLFQLSQRSALRIGALAGFPIAGPTVDRPMRVVRILRSVWMSFRACLRAGTRNVPSAALIAALLVFAVGYCFQMERRGAAAIIAEVVRFEPFRQFADEVQVSEPMRRTGDAGVAVAINHKVSIAGLRIDGSLPLPARRARPKALGADPDLLKEAEDMQGSFTALAQVDSALGLFIVFSDIGKQCLCEHRFWSPLHSQISVNDAPTSLSQASYHIIPIPTQFFFDTSRELATLRIRLN
jgi:hypothetical protein